jgi:subtilisin family serine protease/subtilisin-like proprotein convertase family protein
VAETFQVREPSRRDYEVDSASGVQRAAVAGSARWLSARPRGGGRTVQFGRRLVVRFRDAAAANRFNAGLPIPPQRLVDDRTLIVTLANPADALRQAADLAGQAEVEFARPAARFMARRHFAYAAAPNDPYYARQEHLDPAEPANGAVDLAATINARAAWSITRGEGVVVGVGDDGLDLTHPDLAANIVGPSRNFFTGSDSGAHPRSTFYHGTAVGGLIAARAGNGVGISGVAPRSGLGALVIWSAADAFLDDPDTALDDANLAEVFGFANDTLAVQNHSWGNSDFLYLEVPAVQSLALSNAVTTGRGGRGVIFVRSAGNIRTEDFGRIDGVGDANVDGYANDLLQITVGAVRSDGRVASYSVTGACILVAAPGGENTGAFEGLVTTDPRGTKGDNRFVDPVDPSAADYLFGNSGFVGTSAAAPVVSGVVALVLSANPQLGWRDVQQVLALTARQVDRTDPDSATNGVGWAVSHNTGFGVVDAGAAVRLAQRWSNRPPAVRHRYLDTNHTLIPDEGFRVRLSGAGVPETLASLPATGGTGRYPDAPTADVALKDVGGGNVALAPMGGAGALVRRGSTTFATMLNNVANAGGGFGVIANNSGTTERVLMLDTDFTRVPAASIGANDGAALRALVATNANVRARLELASAVRTFAVTNSMVLEHVRLRVRWQHARQGDLRVTLRSPAGTLSVLHRPGRVNAAPVGEWTYGTTHHLCESSLGTWTLAVTDIGEAPGATGELYEAELLLDGVPIEDADADGLDDGWERRWFAGLADGPRDDPDSDGWNNAAEQLQGSDPTRANDEFVPTLSMLPGRVRVSWPATEGATYELWSAPMATGPWTPQAVPSRFPEGAFFLPANEAGFFRLRRAP